MNDKKTKSVLKEKFVSIYETFFKGEDFSTKPNIFWDELFLIKLNSNFIINEFKNLASNEDLIKLKKNINFLYNKAIDYLKFETNAIRLHNIIHTLYLFTYSISVTKQIRLNSIETLEFLVGIDNADLKFQAIFDAIYSILINEETSHLLKTISLKYLLALATQVENVNDNLFMGHFMANNALFEAIIQIVSNPISRSCNGRDAVLLLTILLQYCKYDSENNPYVVKLSILDDELALTGLAMIMSSVLAQFNRIYNNARASQEGQESSWWNSVGNLLGSMFVGDEERRRAMTLDESVLLIFYECVHVNRNFIATLTHAATEFSATPTDTAKSASNVSSTSSIANPVEINMTAEQIQQQQFNSVAGGNMRLLNPMSLSLNTGSGSIFGMDQETSTTTTPTTGKLDLSQDLNGLNRQAVSPPSNLLVLFLQACSAILQETKIENTYDTIKMFSIILVCITEDTYANSLIHDSSALYSVFLYQAKLRHRKVNIDKVPQSRQLACSILDLIIEFIQSHLMKNFPLELYLKAIGIIHRLMCYQRKYRVRLEYNWQHLWTCLISTLKFAISYESTLIAKGNNMFLLYSKIIVIFNIFITYGDTFLPNPESYDYLYYDIMRMRQVFDNLLILLNRYISSSEWKEHVIRLLNQMSNIKTILNHFSPKIDAWSAANHVASLTEQQVLEIVRSNYESLTLKLEDDLDQFERYSENPGEASYFSTLTKRIISDTRSNISDLSKFDQVNMLSLSQQLN